MNQSREWTYGLFSAVVLFLISIFFIGFDFYTQLHTSIQDTGEQVKTLEYNVKDVRFYSEKYNLKENTFNALLKKHPVSVPPIVVPVTDNNGTTTAKENVVPPLADIKLGQ